MTSFALLPPVFSAVILLFILCLSLLNYYILFVALTQTRRWSIAFSAALPLAVCYALITLLTTWIYETFNGLESPPVTLFFAGLPVAIYLAFIALGGGLAAVLLLRERKYRNSALTKSAIKESADNLPAGLCLAAKSGVVLLSNRSMERLCHTLTGRDLQDADVLWNTLTSGELKSGAERLPDTAHPILRLADGRTWSFTRRVVEADGQPITYITAADTTDLDALRVQLQADNAALAEMGARLRNYSHSIIEVRAREERLDTKTRIHDELGYALTVTHHIFEEGNRPGAEAKEKAEEILTLWKRNIAVLRGAAEAEKTTALGQLTAAAKAVGVRVCTQGEPPKEPRTSDLIFNMAGECLNNAVRHARAGELHLEFTETGQEYITAFSNDGKQPEGEITEGGGLSGLRRKIQDAGGTMEVAHQPRFTLTITIPKGGSK